MTILFYPDLPKAHHKISYVCKKLNIEITNDVNSFYDLAIWWCYETIYNDMNWIAMKNISFINRGGFDTSKSRVNKVFKSVFGYGTLINPLEYKGQCVEKSENQCQKNAELIDCPAERKENKVYQIFIDTRIGKYTEDIRVPIFKEDIPLLLIRRKEAIFRNRPKIEVIKDINKVFSNAELIKIRKFCKVFDVQYCELDVLRDKDSKIYIVDVNNVAADVDIIRIKNKERLQDVRNIFTETFKNNFL